MGQNTAEAATTVIYEAEWPGFEREPSPGNVIRIDLHREAPQPDWLTMTEIFKEEETAAFQEADASGIYDYEIETQRPVPPLEAVSERVSWRQRAKRLMGKANDKLRDASISAFAAAQAKTEQLRSYYDDEEAGTKRRKLTGAVAGVLAVGTAAYLGSKGFVSSGSSHRHAAETALNAKAPATGANLDFTAIQHVAPPEPHHAVHAASQAHDSLVTVHEGDNPWTISEHHLIAEGNPHPSDAQIIDYDRRMARANPDKYTFGDDSSQYIPVGTRLRLP